MLVEDMARLYADPLGFVMYAYPWTTDPTLQIVELMSPWRERYGCKYGPDAWACKFLDDLGGKIKGQASSAQVEPIREAIASGHGIGKSALVAWIVDFIMSTRPHCKGTVTANTMPQLESKTWAEIAKWTKKCITGHWFDVTTGRGSMKMVSKQSPESWFCNAQTCREENSEAFAGQHAVNSTSFYIFDEASAVPDKIDEVSEGGLTDGEPMKFAFGNPTRNTGWFANCFKRMRHRWGTRQIDSRSVQITNKKLLQDWVDDYGENSDFVKVRVRGMFPSMSARQFISVEDVDAAYDRYIKPPQYEWAARIITVDPAWEGDDELVIGMRQGLKFEILAVIAKNDNDFQIAKIVADLEDQHLADAVFVDAGFGTGIISAGKTMGRNWQIVWFSGASGDPGCLNKRMEMWKSARDWLKSGGCIPPDPVLYNDLIAPELIGRADGLMQLESKKDMKARGQASPGRGDALALSFAYPVQKKNRTKLPGAHNNDAREYDPYANT
jgi:hypothetical protein